MTNATISVDWAGYADDYCYERGPGYSSEPGTYDVSLWLDGRDVSVHALEPRGDAPEIRVWRIRDEDGRLYTKGDCEALDVLIVALEYALNDRVEKDSPEWFAVLAEHGIRACYHSDRLYAHEKHNICPECGADGHAVGAAA